jgi:serine/threonine-protein kinase RsbW
MADASRRSCLITTRIRADERSVRRLLVRIVGRLAPSFDREVCGTVELALAEVLNNVVEHAYACRTPGPVRVELCRRTDGLFCRIEDEGWPMPDLQLPEGRSGPVGGPIEDLAEGGWGWGLIRALTADISYERRGGTNRLAFRIPLATGG